VFVIRSTTINGTLGEEIEPSQEKRKSYTHDRAVGIDKGRRTSAEE
jgi:hypothetical protein